MHRRTLLLVVVALAASAVPVLASAVAMTMPDWDSFSWSGQNGTAELGGASFAPTVDGVRDSVYDSGWTYELPNGDGRVMGVVYDNSVYMLTEWGETGPANYGDNAWSVFMGEERADGYNDEWSRRLDLVVGEDGQFIVDKYMCMAAAGATRRRWWAAQDRRSGARPRPR